MRASIRDGSMATLGIVVAFFLASCVRYTGVSGPVEDHVIEAEKRLSAAMGSNAGIESFKGIGNIRYVENGRIQSVRAVWAGVVPDKIRIEALGASGQPMVRLATDGTWFYLDSAHPQRFYKSRSRNRLGKLFPVAITADALISLLVGRPPVCEHRSLSLQPNRDGSGSFLVLKRRWRGIAQKIFFDPAGKSVVHVEVFDSTGGLAYRAQLEDRKTVSGFSLPFRLRLFKNEQPVFGLAVDRYWINVPVKSSLFTLTPP